MRAYHRVDPLMDERKSHYTPAQFGAFLKVQLLAGRQTHRGRFRSMKALEGALPSAYAKHVAFLVEQRDLIEQADGLYLDGWDEWQEGDVTVKDRMARIRGRRRTTDLDDYPTSPRELPRDRTDGAGRTALWRLRTSVFERDDHTCRYCGISDYPRGWLVAEHVIPEPDGPTNMENLVTACRACNKRKGPRTPQQAGMALLPSRDTSQGVA